MSGGISYSGIVNRGKVTLPSVESWGTNMNIIKDPPKSITTRKKERVGDSIALAQSYDSSTDRIQESIRVYARGVNPSVSVSYNNSDGGTQASLPHTIMKGGAFRPPVLTQEDLLPLSRMPRKRTSTFTNKTHIDYSRRLTQPMSAAKTRQVITNILTTNARPTAVYKLEQPVYIKNTDTTIHDNITNPSAHTGVRATDRTHHINTVPTSEINENVIRAHARANVTNNQIYINNNAFDPTRYIQDITKKNVLSNISYVGGTTTLDDAVDMTMKLKDKINYSTHSNVNGHTKTDYIHEDLELARTLPSGHLITNANGHTKTDYIHEDLELTRTLPSWVASTNINSASTQKNIEHTNTLELSRNTQLTNYQSNPVAQGNGNVLENRTVVLGDSLNQGGYQMNGYIPKPMFINNDHVIGETQSNTLYKNAMRNMRDRK